ncbi:helix-turn-helix transcriptional regulator [Sphingosinicella sp. LY1275]|uniref:helix-turn-helix domain-containing protein n=1 Tax=Sphingosinicella sp. LY1275 TaxID=3095379 RepID=UPI002ADEBE82|nr:helix-turn-helix transcriptional regulator [Sphingosinicella sp. LY1275]MEA1015156.1 helix-turn-helix transcriptional regulator [Sphingosinicella sp. LY1275]
MSRDIFADAVDWQPELSPERRERVARHLERFAAAATMFKRARQELGLSQVEAAARLGTTQANVSKIEKRHTAEVGQLEKLVADTDYEVVVLLRSRSRQREIVLSN